MSARMVVNKSLKICPWGKGAIIKSSFSEFWKLAKVMQQFKGYLFWKNNLILAQQLNINSFATRVKTIILQTLRTDQADQADQVGILQKHLSQTNALVLHCSSLETCTQGFVFIWLQSVLTVSSLTPEVFCQKQSAVIV